MKLAKNEENRLFSEGILATAVFAMVLVGTLFGGNFFLKKTTKERDSIVEANANLLATNRRDAKEIKFLRENQQAIETMWSTLKSWGTGVSASSIGALTTSGLVDNVPLPATKVPGNPTEYSGLKISGDKTEFQRLLDALATVENQQGLLQVRYAILQLPASAIPNNPKPIYLNIQMELVAPFSK